MQEASCELVASRVIHALEEWLEEWRRLPDNSNRRGHWQGGMVEGRFASSVVFDGPYHDQEVQDLKIYLREKLGVCPDLRVSVTHPEHPHHAGKCSVLALSGDIAKVAEAFNRADTEAHIPPPCGQGAHRAA